MKKLLPGLFVLLTACTRQHVCECSIVRAGTTSDADSESKVIIKGSRASAETSCTALEEEGSDGSGAYTKACRIEN